jgi:transposase
MCIFEQSTNEAMLKLQQEVITSPHADLYDILIPADNFFRRFHDEVDFSFLHEELATKYSGIGRCAVDPIRMMKYLILKIISNLSDVDLMEEVRLNMGYKYFLDMAPEDMPIEASTLCKFRTQRLKDADLMSLLLGKTLKMALERGILKQNVATSKIKLNLIIDGTHTESRFKFYQPIPALKLWATKLRSKIYKYHEELQGQLQKDDDIDTLDEEIKYCQKLVDYAKTDIGEALDISDYRKVAHRLEELVRDIKDHYTVCADSDARVGHKTKDTSFTGFKTQIVMDEESRLAVGAKVTTGDVGDALPGKEVLEEIVNDNQIQINEVLGDTAYSGQPILHLAEENNFKMIAPPHPILGQNIDGRDGFTFNKDADMFCCPKGHLAISKHIHTYKADNNRKAIAYNFDPKICGVCPRKEKCIKGNAKFRSFSVTKLTLEQQKLLQESKTEYFQNRRRQRYKIEAKNAHLKQRLGYGKAFGKGIGMMTVQAAVSLFVSNIKIILNKK